jgi:hypothetical protein
MPLKVSLSMSGSLRIEEEVKIEAKISCWSKIDELEILLNSEEFHEIHPQENLIFPKEEQGNFIMKPFLRSKSLSRTVQRFSFIRKHPSNLQEATLVYRSPLPETALNYNFRLRVRTMKNADWIQTKLNLEVGPGPPVFLHCSLLRANGRPRLRCSALDRRGNESREPLGIKGKLPGTTVWKNFEIKGSQDLPLSNPVPPFSRFEYLFEGRRLYSNALPEPKQPVFFGDLHTHSEFSDSRVPITPSGLFDYGRDVAHLDFMAITDHAEPVFGSPLSRTDFETTRREVQDATQKGYFTAFLGFEWTSTFHNPASPWGHRTVIYPGLKGQPYRADQSQTDTPKKLYAATGEVFSFPHHSLISWGAFHWDRPLVARYEKGVEVFSAHGLSLAPNKNQRMQDQDPKGAVERAIKKRYPITLLASSDTHAGHPGLNDWPGVKPGLMDGGGLVAVFAKKNTRKAIFRSLVSHRFYATSGTRILLYPASDTFPFPLKIYGTHPLKTAVLREFLPGKPVQVRHFPLTGLNDSLHCQLNRDTYAYYLTLIQSDGERAWIGPWYRSK